MSDSLLSPLAIRRLVRRMAVSIVDEVSQAGADRPEEMALIGIRRGGVPVSQAIATQIAEIEGLKVPLGTVDIGLYRDDAATSLPEGRIGPSHIPFEIKGRDLVLVDDVLQTGRTVRAAIDCLLDYGRPKRIWLATLFDRGGRELPIRPDIVGQVIELPSSMRLLVDAEDDGTLRALKRSRS